ncbi:3-methyl-2-oxobutanoate hydroxymethyltransferase [Alkalihalobacillus pseudalcaliphilus]|uniref:3-methyl-2-oxobutanoate hydroxymethyltransferase n=1 Tax=Alkalihalobacillus pseudalcaliphilus TaxID=79884 RepID=UPI00064DE4E7|nr:3-methyl-2-oxobutanoate hydroxymethyltransferase [Alkalihalobacillus pseudalcaliphilus]KMK76412.1 3-methyl-2-oxobutanoate hydroxymethyltransferase [Alkalihalobacillus pseudalcaliphilus]
MKTTASFMKMKRNQEKIAMMTAYDAPSAKLVEEAGMDLILVGDSLGMVVLGYDSTVPVTLCDMVMHTKAVKRGAKNTFVVTDMPFLSYHASLEETFQSAKSLMQDAQADAVKLEGAGEVVTAIDKLTNAGVPVMAHLGLMPQSVGVLGGYKVQGKDEESAARLLEDTKAVEAAGAFAVVLECVPESVAGWITEQVNIPVIGIGAGVQTDGQVLVYHDVIGYGSGHVPKFVKKYANVADTIGTAVTSYVEEVKAQKFPQKEHSFHADVKQVQLYGGK